jgi:histidinol-phosphatase (PHP family)
VINGFWNSGGKGIRNVKWDGHTHTKFCRHGSAAELEEYLERALALGFERYTVTEHPPLPAGWVKDHRVMQELAMDLDELGAYLDYAWGYKERYAERIDIRVGLEFDYLHGQESFTWNLVERCGERLEEAIVSVHFLPGKDGMRCVDLSADDFRDGLLDYYGSVDKVVETYFDHVELAIELAGKLPCTTRLGHVLLIEKFRTALPPMDEGYIRMRLERLIPLLREHGVGVDVNTAGLRKPTCGKVYVPDWFHQACLREGIDCVFGSDAHRPDEVGAGWDQYARPLSVNTR